MGDLITHFYYFSFMNSMSWGVGKEEIIVILVIIIFLVAAYLFFSKLLRRK